MSKCNTTIRQMLLFAVAAGALAAGGCSTIGTAASTAGEAAADTAEAAGDTAGKAARGAGHMIDATAEEAERELE